MGASHIAARTITDMIIMETEHLRASSIMARYHRERDIDEYWSIQYDRVHCECDTSCLMIVWHTLLS